MSSRNCQYVDASVVLRLLLDEPGPRITLARGSTLVSSQIVEVETFRALDRARLTGELDDWEVATKQRELADFLRRLHLVPVSPQVIATARTSFPVCVRALDTIHVATAQLLTSRVTGLLFWTHDKRQATAAMSRGFAVEGLSAEELAIR